MTAAVEIHRPLLLTPGQDIVGYLLSHAGRALLLLLTGVSVVAVGLIFLFITREAWPFFAKYGVGTLVASASWYPEAETPEFGAMAILAGSFYVMVGSLVIAVPVGLLTAVLLSDIVPFKVRQVFKPIVEILAAIPSVAYGFFAVLVVAPWMQASLHMKTGTNALNASIILAIMAIPTIVSVSEDALTAIGRELREASYACGATRAETLLLVVIPAAHNGIIAAVILGMMRAVGETMVVWMASGNASQIPSPWWDLTQSVRTLTATIAGDMGESVKGGDHYRALFALGFVLLAFTFVLNLATEYFLRRVRQSIVGKAPVPRKGRYILHRIWGGVETAAGKIFSLSGRIVALPFRPLRPLRDRLSNLFGRVVTSLRSSLNQSFTVLAAASGVLVAGSLVVILLPMLYKGCGAVVFQGTVEFRRMQLEQFKRGDGAEIQAETASANEVRAGVYAILDNFRHGIDTSDLQERARYVYRELGKQLQNRNLDAAQYASTRSLAKDLRDNLLAAYETSDKVEALKRLDAVLAFAGEPSLAGTRAQEFFEMAKDYRRTAETIDLSRRAEYAVQFREVQQIVRDLLGPRPGDPAAPIILEQYGATRMDRAEFLLDRLVWMDEWVSDGEGKPLVKVRVHRQKAFRGTELAGLFEYVESHAKEMLRPRWTFYWQYFLDDSVSSHYFGGVGPEIAGTLALAVLAILFALPLGVVAAAYLVECAGDNHFVNVIRTCVNTLAGVPSIVFGLFGLAFFVIFLLPLLGMSEGSSILAGALTLALLVLPIIIRASEEAIRSVPQSFREASLALGASRFRGFVTVTLPAALPGILTGVILSVSRAAGETAPILFTAAVALGPPLWTQGWGALGHPTRTLSYSSYDIAVSDKLAAMAPHNQFGMVMTLVALVLALNILAIVVRSRMVKRLRGQ